VLSRNPLFHSLLYFIITTAPSEAGNFYLSPAGSDAYPGTREKPFASPGYATRQLQPGDTLIILGGTYRLSRFDEDILMPKSGTAGGWITIRGEPGNRPVLAGAGNLFAAVILGGCSYIRMEHLEITHDPSAEGSAAYFRDGIHIVGDTPSRHIILKDLYIHHIDEYGLDVQDADSMEITGCRIEYCGFGSVGGPPAVHGGWRHVRIDGCRFSYSGHYYRGGEGSGNPYDRPDGFGIEASDGPVEIVNTVAEHNYGDGLDSKASNTAIRQCTIANNSCDGVKLWGGGSLVENTLVYGRGDGDATPTDWAAVVIGTKESGAAFTLQNVTVDDSIGNNYLMYAQYGEDDVPISLTIRNCIFSGRGPRCSVFVRGEVSLTCEYNLLYLPNVPDVIVHGEVAVNQSNIGGFGKGNRYGDPKFIRPTWGMDGDYHLQEGSPALDAAAPDGSPSADLDGRGRPVGEGVDMGCYEADFTTSGTAASSSSGPFGFALQQNYPNPMNATTTIRFGIGEPCRVVLKVFDIQGREVSVLADAKYPAGEHAVRFNAAGLESGVYLFSIQAGDYSAMRKMVVMK